MFQASRRRLILSTTGLFFAVFCFCSLSLAAGMPKAEQDAFLELATHVPKNASIVTFSSGLKQSVENADRIVRKYGQVDKTFDYDKFILSLKGGIGYDPFSLADYEAVGLDMNYGIATFILDQGGPPLIVFKTVDAAKTAKALAFLAKSIGRAMPAPESTVDGLSLHFFLKEGRTEDLASLVYVEKDGIIYLMAAPTNKDWFIRHVKATHGLKMAQSIAADRNFKTLLQRLEPGTSLVSYNNYAQYVKDLKKSAQNLKTTLQKEAGPDVSGLDLLNTTTAFAEGFTAQIFGVKIDSERASFVHELTGPKKKVQEFRTFFAPSSKKSVSRLAILQRPIGLLYGNVNFDSIDRFLEKKSAIYKTELRKLSERLKKESGLDIEKDLLANAGGPMLAAYYGQEPLPTSITDRREVRQEELAALAKLAFAAVVKDPKGTAEMLKKVEAGQKAAGKAFSTVTIAGSSFYEVNSQGLPIQFGVHRDLFLLGIGKNALRAALEGKNPLNTAVFEDTLGYFNVDVGAFAATMENLKPPPNSLNTQLHQQYRVWKLKAADKVRFMKALEARTVEVKGGFRSTGEIRY